MPQFQNNGIGKKLYNEISKFFNPSQKTIVKVATYNKKAIEFYKKLGFIDTGKRFTNDKIITKKGVNIPKMEMVLEK